jgi:nucleoside-diphosphate-sugar epimerase
MKNVLVVGSTGFVGQNFTTFLTTESNISFATLDRKLSAKPHKQLVWNDLEILDLEQFDFIFYFTGKAHDLKKTSNDQAYFDINVRLLERFLSRLQESNFAGNFLFLSSVKAVADEVYGVLTEDIAPNPKTPYGKSKLEAEKVIFSSFLADKAVILRPCMIHGKGNKGNLNLLFQMVYKGFPNVLADFKNERSLLSIDNLVIVFNAFLNHKLSAGAYQVADSGFISTTVMMEVMANVTGKKLKNWAIPKTVISLVAKIGDFLPLPLNSDRLQKLTENYRVSNRKICQEMKQEMPFTIKQGLQNTIESFAK